MSDLINIWLNFVPFLGGPVMACFFVIIAITLMAWFNRAGLPVIAMTVFLLFFSLREVNQIFFSLMAITIAISGYFTYQGIMATTGNRP